MLSALQFGHLACAIKATGTSLTVVSSASSMLTPHL
jgi:hypothetical protein